MDKLSHEASMFIDNIRCLYMKFVCIQLYSIFILYMGVRYSKSIVGANCGPCHLFGSEKRSLVSQPATRNKRETFVYHYEKG